jgi:hypothetical protein
LTGDDRVRSYLTGKIELDVLLDQWEKEEREFEAIIKEIRLY